MTALKYFFRSIRCTVVIIKLFLSGLPIWDVSGWLGIAGELSVLLHSAESLLLISNERDFYPAGNQGKWEIILISSN